MDQQSLTDPEIQREVRDALAHDARFATTTIDVTVQNGAAILTGLVPDPRIRAEAVRLVQHLRGVREVVDRLQVQPFIPRFDADITADVVTAITLNTATNPARIDVQTIDGIVYLRGSVPDPTTRQLIDSIARSVDGVRDVIDDLAIAPAIPHPDSEIARRLREQLATTLQPDAANRIRIEVRNGVVYLRGEVETVALRWAIEDLARWSDGVVDVVDELHGPAASAVRPPPG